MLVESRHFPQRSLVDHADHRDAEVYPESVGGDEPKETDDGESPSERAEPRN